MIFYSCDSFLSFVTIFFPSNLEVYICDSRAIKSNWRVCHYLLLSCIIGGAILLNISCDGIAIKSNWVVRHCISGAILLDILVNKKEPHGEYLLIVGKNLLDSGKSFWSQNSLLEGEIQSLVGGKILFILCCLLLMFHNLLLDPGRYLLFYFSYLLLILIYLVDCRTEISTVGWIILCFFYKL